VTSPRFSFGSIWMSCVDLRASVDAFFGFTRRKRGGYIACTCTHGIVESERDPQLRQIHNDSLLTLPDGMPTVWMGRAKGYPVRRVTATDFLEGVLLDPRARFIRHYFLGGSEETLAQVCAKAADLVGPGAVAGSWSPPIRPAGTHETPDTLRTISATKPDVIWVSLGLPKQEYWMAQHAAAFPGTVMVGVGAAFDWFAGAQPRASDWLQAMGLEWAHRVMCEPARLWPRYRVVVPNALGIMARECLAFSRLQALWRR
jgi:N-acetylglucosaminyldiphosphoundecaprenol N-acetyl-beta-D-mannosaminyltransferase